MDGWGVVVRIVKLERGRGLPVGYGSKAFSPSTGLPSRGLNLDSTGDRYLTVSYRPAKSIKGGEEGSGWSAALLVVLSALSESCSGKRVK